jgi:hypothetical protein
MAQEWNPSGYLWNVAARAEVDAEKIVTAKAVAGSRADRPVPANFRNTCLVCHDEDIVRQQRLTRAQWERELNKMIGWGARVTPEDRATFLDYLSAR